MSKVPSANRRGYRSLSEAFDDVAKFTPDRVYAKVPRSDDLRDGFDEVSMGQMEHAVDSCAHWLLKQSQGIRDDFETIGYVGLYDLRYPMMFWASLKCGKKLQLISPASDSSQNVSLLQSASCQKFYCSKEKEELALSLKQSMPDLQIFILDPFERWIANGRVPFPFRKTYEEAKWDPVAIVHTSGSTGHPKPILLTNGYFASNFERELPKVPGREAPGHRIYDFSEGGCFFSVLLPYHLAGVMWTCYYPVFSMEATPVFGPPSRFANGVDVKHIMDQIPLRIFLGVPAVIEHVASLPGGVEHLQKLDYLAYTGGPLNPTVGNRLAKHTQICSFYGSGEIGLVPNLMPRKEDWEWLEIHSAYHADMEPQGDGTYELVLRKTGDQTTDEMRGTYWTRPDFREWFSKDLFEAHPSKPGLWRYYGRQDDVLVLANGAKLNPVPLESMIQGHPSLSGALLVGTGKNNVGVLLEPRKPVKSDAESLAALQELIDEANSRLSSTSKITRYAFVEPGAFARAPKGTVVRGATCASLGGRIDEMYAGSNNSYTGIC